MVRFWTRFWRQYRDVLVRGVFAPGSPTHNYPVLRGWSPDVRTEVAVLYADQVVRLDSMVQEFVVVNARRRAGVAIECSRDKGLVSIEVRDVLGELVSEEETLFPAGVHRLDVPPSGVVTIRTRR